jgi:hypothetical protein
VASYLGIVVIWYDRSKIHRAILEFAKSVTISIIPATVLLLIVYPFRLTEKHDGKYLANVLASCVNRYGLEDFVCDFELCVSVMTDYIVVDSRTMHGQCW